MVNVIPYISYRRPIDKNRRESFGKQKLPAAYIVHIFFNKFMLHIWVKPKLSVGWHKKYNSGAGELLWIERYT
jgi:hypothetical protein